MNDQYEIPLQELEPILEPDPDSPSQPPPLIFAKRPGVNISFSDYRAGISQPLILAGFLSTRSSDNGTEEIFVNAAVFDMRALTNLMVANPHDPADDSQVPWHPGDGKFTLGRDECPELFQDQGDLTPNP